ncbi:MAG TPA: LemA family protein [Candidatus Paceibacterota bacterium]|nr:LemA family protein [Candidatus Paceibacterota bacterium]
MNPLTIVVILLVLVAVWLMFTFNRLVTWRNRVKEASSDIEVQQKRRYDLIPNIVETVKGYAKHEDAVFTKVTQARAAAMGATDPKAKLDAENALSSTLKSLFAVSESYPELKANQNFLALQQELTDTEDKIQAARRFFNTNVRDYNTSLETFPTNMIANMFGFKPYEFFDAEPEAEQPVKVQF